MASTFTINTGIELIANGEKSGTWGDTTNLNLEIIDRLTNGVGSITLSGTTHTLTTTDGELSDGQFKVLVFGGTPSGTNTVTISPNDQDKQFFIVNNSGQSIILTQGSGTSVTVPNGAKDIVFADGGGAGANVANFSADLSGVLLAANNLSDLGSAATALTNLGLTATAAELNILDGVTATAAELNILDGVTATAAELNILDGVTATAAELNILDGVTATAAELNLIDGSAANTVVNSKAVIYGSSGEVTANQIDILAQGDLRLQDTTGGEFVALQAPGTVSSSYTLTLPAADGTAGQFIKTDGSGALSFDSVSSAVQYPQESKSANYTLVLADAGKHIFHPASDGNLRDFTIPANSSVAFPIGTVVLFTVENGGTAINVKITSDTLVTNKSITGNVFVDPGNTLYCIKTASTKWQAYYLFQLSVVPSFNVAVAHDGSPFVSVYPLGASGLGAKYANPATSPTGNGSGVAFSPAADAIAVAHATAPQVSAYPWSDSGFGTKYANPATLPAGNGRGVAFSPAGDAIAVAHNSSPHVSAYPWSGSGFGTKFSDPATLPAGDGIAVAFSPAGDAIAVGHSNNPRVTAYPWSGSGFGTKYADPATLPAGDGQAVAFSPAGDAIAVVHDSDPRVTAYPWSGSGFGTKYADPATLPGLNGRGVAFSPAGDAIAVSSTDVSRITTYPWSGSGFGIKFADPATQPASNAFGVAISNI